MKKSKLIELLNQLEDDPEIMLWNGYASDWMDVDKKLVDTDQVKMTFEHYINSVEIEEKIDRKDWDYTLSPEQRERLKKSYLKDVCWESNDWVCEEDIENKRYKSRRVVYLQAKTRGVSTWDRMGTIEY
jgi:hypothetical protein